MTPMVDLGFLLITFFMFTTNFSKPNILDLGLPAKSDIPTPNVVDVKNSINFIIGENGRVYFHQTETKGLKASDLTPVSLDGLEVAKVISNAKKNAVDSEKFTVIIKPTDEANYKNFVDMLDNLSITNNERYGITDIKPDELQAYKQLVK